MGGWFQDLDKRQSDLARGVDADLVRANRNRLRRAVGLIGFGFLLGLLISKIKISGTLRTILLDLGIGFIGAGFVLSMWAREEAKFLNKPDPEEPPRLFKL